MKEHNGTHSPQPYTNWWESGYKNSYLDYGSYSHSSPVYYYDYSKILEKFSGFNDTYKKRREFKKDFEKLIKKSRKPINIKVGASLTNIFKTRKMQVSISNKDIDKFEDKKDVVISAFDKIPMNAKAFYGKALQYLITEDVNWLEEYISD